MSRLYAIYHGLAGWVCEVDPVAKRVREIHDQVLYEQHLPDGEYVQTSRSAVGYPAYENRPGRLVGVVKSPSGPLFFVNNDIYPLVPGSFSIDFASGETENRFRLRIDGREILAIRYAKRLLAYDAFENDEDFDLFLWLDMVSHNGWLFRRPAK